MSKKFDKEFQVNSMLDVVIPAIKEHRQVSVRRSDTSEVWNVSTTGE